MNTDTTLTAGTAVFYRGPGRRHGSIGTIGTDPAITLNGVTYYDIVFHENGRDIEMLAVPTANIETI